MREVGRRGREDTLVCGCIVSIITTASSSSTQPTKIEVELFLWIYIPIHNGQIVSVVVPGVSKIDYGWMVEGRGRTKCHRNETKRASNSVTIRVC